MKVTFENGVLHFYPENGSTIGYCSCSSDDTIFAGQQKISGKQIQEIEIHEGFTTIHGSFTGAPVEKFYIPDGVTTIEYSFYHCSNLTEISFPSSLEKLGSNCLSFCSNLRKIEFRGGYNKGLKIGSHVFGYVFNVTNAEMLFELDTDDEFKAHIFNKEFIVDSMKNDILLAYLKGKPAAGKFEQAILRYAKKSRDSIFAYLLKKNDVEMLEAYIKLFLKGKEAIADLEFFFDRASDKNAVDIKQIISSLKAEQFSGTDIKKHEDDAKLKNLGLKELTVADYKKLYSFKDTPKGYIITQYKGDATDVVIPEMIGTKSVIAIRRGVFQDKGLTSIESPVSPSLADFFGMKTYPKIHVYGHIPLKKNVRLSSLEQAEVNQFVLFGHYLAEAEDGNLQPIVWRVLEKNDNELLMVSRFVIEELPMHNERTKITWEQCEMRRWLNDLFYTFAFNDEEKQKIIKVKNEEIINPKYPKNVCKATEDYVYLPNLEDGGKYIHAYQNSESTDYLNHSPYWSFSWYSSNGRYSTSFSCYEARGCNYEGHPCDALGGINPIIRIKL